jgi:hypothetical protein
VLELAAGAHRRPAALVASLGPSEAHTAACLPTFRLHAAVHRAAAVATNLFLQLGPVPCKMPRNS